MKTLKVLKITSILHGIFCLCCIVSILCMCFIPAGTLHNVVQTLGVISVIGWMFNPSPFICTIVGLVIFLSERDNPEERKALGKKGIWFFLWPLIDIFCYLAAIFFLVFTTGGV